MSTLWTGEVCCIATRTCWGLAFVMNVHALATGPSRRQDAPAAARLQRLARNDLRQPLLSEILAGQTRRHLHLGSWVYSAMTLVSDP